MTTTEFSGVKLDETGGIIESTGALAIKPPSYTETRAAADGATTFSICMIAGARIGVFADLYPSSLVQQQIANTTNPTWLNAIVYAHITDAGEAIDVKLAAATAVESEAIAFASVCVTLSHGKFTNEPTSYLVNVSGQLFEVTLDFDWDTQTWHGAVAAR